MGGIWGTVALHHQVQVVLEQSWGRDRGIWRGLRGSWSSLVGDIGEYMEGI